MMMMMIAYIIKLEKNVKSSVVFFWKQHTKRILEIFEIQRPLAKGFLKISHHRIIIIAERLLRPRTEEQWRFKRRRRIIKRTETHRWSRQNREPGWMKRRPKNVVVSFLNETFCWWNFLVAEEVLDDERKKERKKPPHTKRETTTSLKPPRCVIKKIKQTWTFNSSLRTSLDSRIRATAPGVTATADIIFTRRRVYIAHNEKCGERQFFEKQNETLLGN